MKNKKWITFLTAAALTVSALAFAACGGDDSVSSQEQNSLLPETVTEVFISDDSVGLFVEDYYVLQVLDQKGNAVTDNVSWSSANATVASVNDAGKVTAVAVGETTVSATYKDTTLTCNVYVYDGVMLTLSDTRTTLYTVGQLRGETFAQTDSFTATLVKETGEKETVAPTWSVEDETVATVENGVVTAGKAGKTRVFAEYTAAGKTLRSFVDVEVAYPVVDVAFAQAFMIDMENPVFEEKIFTDGGENQVRKIADETAGKYVSVSENGELNQDELASGERTYIFYNDLYGYRVQNVIVADKVISDADELCDFLSMSSIGNTKGRYITLEADIDMTDRLLFSGHAFAGTFNGMGHSIYNIYKDVTTEEMFAEPRYNETNACVTLFGTIAGTIKNLGVVNCYMPKGSDGILSGYLNPNSLLENVFIHIKSSETSDQSGAITRFVCNPGNRTLRNTIVYWECNSYHRYNALCFAYGSATAEVTFENSYVIAGEGGTNNLVGTRYDMAQYATFCEKYMVLEGVKYTMDKFGTQSGADYDAFTGSGLWNLREYKFPIMESSAKILCSTPQDKIYKDLDGVIENAGEKLVLVRDAEDASLISAPPAGGIYSVSLDTNDSVVPEAEEVEKILIAGMYTNATYEGGVLSIPETALAGVSGDMLPVRLFAKDGSIYEYYISIVDYVFTTQENFLAFYAGMTAETTKGKLYWLTTDVDFSGVERTAGVTFAGTLDGRGHAIDGLNNYTTSEGAWLAFVSNSQGATFKNIAFTNAEMHDTVRSVIVDNGYAHFDNVFVHVAVNEGNAHRGTLVGYSYGGQNSVKNTVVYWQAARTHHYQAAMFGFGLNAAAGSTVENSYVVEDVTHGIRTIVNDRGSSGDAKYAEFEAGLRAYNATAFVDPKNPTGIVTTGYNAEYWDLTAFGYPVMKVLKDYVDDFKPVTMLAETAFVKTADTAKGVNASGNSVKDGMYVASGNYTVDLTDKIQARVTKIKLGDADITATASFENGILSVPVSAIENLYGEDKRIVLSTADGNYGVAVDIVEALVTTESGFMTVRETWTTATTEGRLYRLGASFSFATPVTTNVTFSGTFDGCGYTIDNYSLGANNVGLFGLVEGEKFATIKNLALTNVSLTKNGGLLFGMNGGSVILSVEQVYIHVKESKGGYNGAIAQQVNAGTTTNLTNVILDWRTTLGGTQNAFLFGRARTAAQTLTLNNSYIINNTTTKKLIGRVDDANDQAAQGAIETAENIAKIVSSNTAIAPTNFNANWTTTGNYPIMTSALAYVS